MSIDTCIETTRIGTGCVDRAAEVGDGVAVGVPGVAPVADLDAHEGWQALAVASLGRVLTDAELTVIGMVPVDAALDAWFPGLGDAARHEALSTLGP